MVCEMQTDQYLVSVEGRQSINGWFLPWVPRSRLGENELCWYIRGMCMEKKSVSWGGRGLGHTLLNMGLLTSFQSQNEQEHDRSWSSLRTAF